MKLLRLKQGSEEWKKARAKFRTASEAPAMMGAHPNVSRNDLLHAKHTGMDKTESSFIRERIFERGHEVEEAARPFAEKLIGQDLYPATGTDDGDYLSASFDGLTIDHRFVWECKQFNKDKAEKVKAGEIPEADVWQCVQQLVVSRAEKLLFTVSDGTEENTYHVWLELDPGDEGLLLAGWQQFEEDLSRYEPRQAEEKLEARKPETLPTLHVEVAGEVTNSNLAEFKSTALQAFDEISTELSTDQDFADADAAVKWLKDVEGRLGNVKDHALAQTRSLDELFREIDDLKETGRQKRLNLERQIKSRKQEIREEIQERAVSEIVDHYAEINGALPKGIQLATPDAEKRKAVGEEMKGKRTRTSLEDAADKIVTQAKLEANKQADRVRANYHEYEEIAAGYHDDLFPDLNSLVSKEPDDFKSTLKLRILEHKEAEEKREAEAQRRAEERAQAEADRKASEQAGAALKQQAEASARDEEPGRYDVEKSGTGKRAVEVKAYCNDTRPGTQPGEEAARVVRVALEEAGFDNVEVFARQLSQAA